MAGLSGVPGWSSMALGRVVGFLWRSPMEPDGSEEGIAEVGSMLVAGA